MTGGRWQGPRPESMWRVVRVNGDRPYSFWTIQYGASYGVHRYGWDIPCCKNDVQTSMLRSRWRRMPIRIQRKRCRGWRMPEGAVYVGRPGKWGNPFRVDKGWLEGPGVCINSTDRLGLLARAVELYRERFIHGELGRRTIREQLGGKDLACWCPLDQPCHADVLLEIANEETP